MEAKGDIKKYVNDVKDLPLWLKWIIAILTLISIVYGLVPKNISPEISTNQEIIANSLNNDVTNKINISDILTKALRLDSVLERQDFLKKYVNSKIYGRTSVTEVSRYGDGYLIDMIVTGQLVSCRLNNDEENERRVPLLKGKTVNFSGIFTLTNILDHGLVIDNCVL